MSREQIVEVIRRSFDAFESMDVERWVADWADDVEFDVSGYEPWKEPSKPPHDVPVGIVYTLRDAKLAHVEVYSDPGAALRAAGLAQRPWTRPFS